MRACYSVLEYGLLNARRCITGSSFGRFSGKEEQCLSSCVERFLDTSLFIVKRIRNLPRE